MGVGVSICMIAYNHEHFIDEAIQSIINQRTNFDFQLVIGEDCSTDGTRKICEGYANKFPNKVKLLPSDSNLGMMPNFVRTLKACDGNYIALCEGDDFWTDELKLQKQFDILESDKKLSISVHQTKILYQDKTTELLVKPKYTSKTIFSQEEMLEAVVPVYQTSSLFFRNLGKYPEWLNNTVVGDIPVFLLAILNGKLHYIDEVMSTYRVHANGISSLQNYATLEHQKQVQEIYDLLIGEAPDKLKYFLSKAKKGRVAKYYLELYRFNKTQNKVKAFLNLLPLFFIGKTIDLSFKDVLWLYKQLF